MCWVLSMYAHTSALRLYTSEGGQCFFRYISPSLLAFLLSTKLVLYNSHALADERRGVEALSAGGQQAADSRDRRNACAARVGRRQTIDKQDRRDPRS